MPEAVAPSEIEGLRERLAEAGAAGESIEVGGAFSKRAMGGPIEPADVTISTRNLNRLLAYEPADLTVSVEAGMSYKALSATLAANNQFLPLDPPFGDDATVGGVLATNTSGPRRRRYGTARDMLIGLQFATVEGKLVKSGGMVVKNVTGLDMGKLIIGSYGTLGAVVSANFKVFPSPEQSATFAFVSSDVNALLELRRSILQGILQPVAIDWLNELAAEGVGLAAGHALLVEVSGSPATVERYRRDLTALGPTGVSVDEIDGAVWVGVREFAARALTTRPEGAVIRVGTTASRIGELVRAAGELSAPAVIRAGNGVGYLVFDELETAKAGLARLRDDGFLAVVESGSDAVRRELDLWRAPETELAVMRRIKADFDPGGLLNRGRLFGLL
jgi:glycolate oxidase FAD binding subunit